MILRVTCSVCVEAVNDWDHKIAAVQGWCHRAPGRPVSESWCPGGPGSGPQSRGAGARIEIIESKVVMG